jgi:hypothetical protein
MSLLRHRIDTSAAADTCSRIRGPPQQVPHAIGGHNCSCSERSKHLPRYRSRERRQGGLKAPCPGLSCGCGLIGSPGYPARKCCWFPRPRQWTAGTVPIPWSDGACDQVRPRARCEGASSGSHAWRSSQEAHGAVPRRARQTPRGACLKKPRGGRPGEARELGPLQAVHEACWREPLLRCLFPFESRTGLGPPTARQHSHLSEGRHAGSFLGSSLVLWLTTAAPSLAFGHPSAPRATPQDVTAVVTETMVTIFKFEHREKSRNSSANGIIF